MTKEKQIIFRLDSQLYNVINGFAAEKGYKNISELMREIIIMHFMGVMLGYFQNKKIDEMMGDFLTKYKDLIKEYENKSPITSPPKED
jgi:hypothetical protein